MARAPEMRKDVKLIQSLNGRIQKWSSRKPESGTKEPKLKATMSEFSLYRMPDLEAYPLQRLNCQLHSWSVSELSDGFQEMCAFPNEVAR